MSEAMNNSEMSVPEAIRWHAEKIIELQAQLIPTDQQLAPLTSKPGIIPAHPAILFDCLGWHEVRDKEALMNFFDVSGGRREDPDETAWCAIMIWTALKKAGINVPYTQNARALYESLLKIGTEIDLEEESLLQGDILGWGSHIASFAGYASKPDQKATTDEEWAEIEDPDGEIIMVIGGNQSNQVNVSPKDWYDRYSEFLGAIRIG